MFIVPGLIAKNLKNEDPKQQPSNKIQKDQFDNEIQYLTIVPEKTNFQNDYKLGYLINNSTEYTISQVTHKATNVLRSVKQWQKKGQLNDPYSLKHQAFYMKLLNHPNIIKAYEFYDETQYQYLVTDFCQGGELFEKIIKLKTFSEREAAKVMYQIFSVVNYLHEKGIVHRSIQPENFVYETKEKDSILKLVSLRRVTKVPQNQMLSERVGTAYYIAPEVLKQSYYSKCDLWSCGVIMYILLSGKPPFNGHKDEEIHSKIMNGNFNFNAEIWQNISDDAMELISNLLQIDPSTRFSAKQALSDPWILNQSIGKWINNRKISLKKQSSDKSNRQMKIKS